MVAQGLSSLRPPKLVSDELRVGVGYDFVGEVMINLNFQLKQDGQV